MVKINLYNVSYVVISMINGKFILEWRIRGGKSCLGEIF